LIRSWQRVGVLGEDKGKGKEGRFSHRHGRRKGRNFLKREREN